MSTVTRVKLPVTQEHIDGGVCNEPGECAIALAFLDFAGLAYPAVVQVSGDGIEVWHYPSHFRLTRDANDDGWCLFIRRFDERQSVSPTTFTLEGRDLPEWMLARIKEREALC